MPCNSDYMDPTNKEKELQETAKLLVYALKKKRRKVPKWVSDAAKDIYCLEDKVVPELCSLIRSFHKEDMDRIVYNGRDKTSRRLADWWEEHEKADKKRS